MPSVPDNMMDVAEPALPGEGLLLGAHGTTMLRRISWLLLWGGVALIAAQTTGWEPGAHSFAAYSIAVLGSMALLLIRHNQVRPALQLLLWGVWLVVSINSFIVSGVRTPGLAGLPFLVMTTAWLIGMRAALAMGLMSLLTLAALVVVEYRGYVPANYPRSTLSIAVVHSLLLLGTLVVASGSLRSFYSRLQQIWELSRAQKAQVEALRQSEQRFAALFRANPVPSSTLDSEGRILDVNDAWVALFGVAAEVARGHTARQLGLWPQDAEWENAQHRLRNQRQIDGAAVTLRTRHGPRPFLLYVAPVEYDGARRLVTSLLDQSDRQAAEAAQRSIHQDLEARVAQRTEELSRMVAKLTTAHTELVQSEKLASLGAMVAGISHELNTPIGNTLTVSSTLHDRVAAFQKQLATGNLKRSEFSEFLDTLRGMAELITRSTERAAELISSFKQVAVDRSSERRRTFEVRNLVDDIVTSLKPGMRFANVTINIDVATGMVCDSFPGPAGQVLTNLLQNAVTHAFGDGVPGRIDIRAEVQEPLVVITVRDNGKGMSEHTCKHAFDPFFTTRMGQGGSGLGLSVSHRIATTMLGGNLSVQSEIGAGSCFTFRFLRQAPALP